MAIKINNTTVIDDSRNAILQKFQFADGTYVNQSGGGLRYQLDNPDAYDTYAPGNAAIPGTIAMRGNYLVIGTLSGLTEVYDVTTGVAVISLRVPSGGQYVAISDTHFIAAQNSANAAYIYDLNGNLIWTLTNPNAYSTNISDYFGASLGIDGNYAIVGAYGEDDATGTNSGTVYIFNVTTGSLLWTLNDPNPYSTSQGDRFGSSVAISGNYAIVGAYSEGDAGGTQSGKAYIYNVTTGALVWTLDNPNAYSTSQTDYFGYSVAISGDYAIVGVYQEDGVGVSESGKAYIYNVTTGALVWTLDNPNAYSTSASDNFGYSVAISGDYAIVGAYNEDDAGGTQSGKAYIYNVTTGALVWTVNNPNASGDNFSSSVAISNDYFAVGASAYIKSTLTNSVSYYGVIYTYKLDTALLNRTYYPKMYGVNTDWFGYSVAVSENYAIVGAYGEGDAGGGVSGKAYIYNVTTGALVWTLNNPNAYSTSNADYFGISVAISGNYAIVGANWEDDVGGTTSGKAYIFNITTGQLVWALNNPNAYGTSQDDFFGRSVAISGNYAIVGAPQEDDAGGADSGKAYIFNVTTGALVWTLDDPNVYSTSTGDYFGYSIAISGNYAIVGAYGESDVGGTTSGKAYIYNVTTGTLLFTLNNPNSYSTSQNDRFGYSVSISGNYAIVGAYGEDDAGANSTASGKAYIYNVTTGALLWTLDNANAYSIRLSDNFGISVAISGNYAIVSANLEDDSSGTSSGKAYIYNVTTGALVWTLNNPNAYGTSDSDFFGHAVSISGNYAVVGAYTEDDSRGESTGKAYIFNITTPQIVNASNFNGLEKLIDNNLIQTRGVTSNTILKQVWTLNDPNAYSTSAGDNFSFSVAVDGNYAVVGALYEDDVSGTSSGKAYIYNVTTGVLVWALNNPNPYSVSTNDYFGRSVAISGNYAIVAASGEDDISGSDSGKAYIYNVTTGQLIRTLDNPTAYSTSAGDGFASSISISGNYAIVGAYGEDDAGGTESGKAYIFNATTGALVWTLNNPTAYSTSAGDGFASSISISGNYAIVGAYGEDDVGGASSGKAYIYNVTTGALVWTLDNPNVYSTSTNDNFGYSVAISGNYAIVGAQGEDPSGVGRAYIYNVTTGALVWTLNEPNANSFSAFGQSVAISGNYAFVGSNSYKAYVFSTITGALLFMIDNPNYYGSSAGDGFASSISISGNYAIVGAFNEDDVGGVNSGKAYIYRINNYNTLEEKLLSIFN